MADIASVFTSTYSSHSGVDITAMFGNMTVQTLSGIAVSVTREKAPIYTVGSASPRSIARGKRGIAGSAMFVLFDRAPLYNMFQNEDHFYYAHADEVNWLTNPVNIAEYKGLSTNFNSTIPQEPDPNAPTGGILDGYGRQGTSFALSGQGLESFGNAPDAVARSVKKAATYSDQIYPFDITVVGQNEYGNAAWMAIMGVEIINEGGGLAVDDLTNEEQFTYIAISRNPWAPITGSQHRETAVGQVTLPPAGSNLLGPSTGVVQGTTAS